jgi:hypothetical protein
MREKLSGGIRSPADRNIGKSPYRRVVQSLKSKSNWQGYNLNYEREYDLQTAKRLLIKDSSLGRRPQGHGSVHASARTLA